MTKEYPVKASVENLRDSADYRNVVLAVEKMAPCVPAFDHKGETNIETIKYELARKAMHEAIVNVINPKGKADG